MIYTQTDLKNAINRRIHGRVGNLLDFQATENDAVRDVLSQVDIRTTKRMSQISPGIYNDEYNYMCPADLKGIAIIDIARQVRRKEEFTLTTAEEFDRRKVYEKGLVAFSDHDGVRILNISTDLGTTHLVIDTLQTATDDGTWSASGDASALSTDYSNFVYGGSSLKFSTASSASAAVISNTTLVPVDLSKYTNNELFIYVYIPSTTGLTSFNLKWGTDASNYWSQTVTTNNEGLAFYTGWNLLRFAWPSTATGSPVSTAVKYASFTINKTGSMTAQTAWRVNLLVARIGDIHNIIYYSKYGWQTASGTYIENSTTTTDLLNVDTDELELIADYGAILAGQELRFKQAEMQSLREQFKATKDNYTMRYPSERKIEQTTNYLFGSIEGDDDVVRSHW